MRRAWPVAGCGGWRSLQVSDTKKRRGSHKGNPAAGPSGPGRSRGKAYMSSGGRMTVSMTWITPLEAMTSTVMTMAESLR